MAQTVKILPAMQETWVGKIPWKTKLQPTPVFLPGESYGHMDRGAWRAIVHGVTKSQTQPRNLHTQNHDITFFSLCLTEKGLKFQSVETVSGKGES